jgi:hypothetical protein
MSAPSTRVEAAHQYHARGWQPVPIPLGEKGPRLPGWNKVRFRPDQLAAYFGGEGNIGILLGAPSFNLVDIDIDAFGVAELADRFLPATEAIFGRAGKLRSHWLYNAPGAKSAKFVDPVTRKTLVELRSAGLQTVFPPSVHPTGELIEWNCNGEPASIAADELLAAVARLAVAILVRTHIIAPYLPSLGSTPADVT